MTKKSKSTTLHSPGLTVMAFIGGFLSLGLLYFIGKVIANDFASFRPCSSNNTDLSIMSCGKASLNSGDFILIILLILSAVLAFTLFTAAIQSIRKARA